MKIILNLSYFFKAAEMDLMLEVFTKNVTTKDQHSFLFLSKKLEDYLELSQIFLRNLKNNGKVFIKMVIHFYFHLDLMELLKNLIIRRIKNMKFIIVMMYWLVLLMLFALIIIVMMLLNNNHIKIGVIWIKDVTTKTMEWVIKRTVNIWQVKMNFQYKKWKFIK